MERIEERVEPCSIPTSIAKKGRDKIVLQILSFSIN